MRKNKGIFSLFYQRINKKEEIGTQYEVVCEKCHKQIKVGERYSFIGTYDRKEDNSADKIISEYYYHISCWIDYFNECIAEKVVKAQKQAFGILQNNPMFQNLMQGVSK